MKSLFLRTIFVVTIFSAVGGTTTVSGQDDLQPLIDSDAEVKSVLQRAETAEDIPPPAPVADELIPEPRAVTSPDLAPPSQPTNETNAYDFGVSFAPTAQGIKVRGVIVGSRAAAAGVMPNDVIVAVNGNPPTVDALQENQVQSLDVMRNGTRRTLRASDRPRSADRSGATYQPENRSAYSVPRTRAIPRQSAYRVPTTTYSTPRSYRYSPSYDERYAPGYVYRSAPLSYARRSYQGYDRPRVSIGYGTGGFGPRIGPGFGGYRGYGGGFGPGIGYGRSGFGYTRGLGRSGFSISIGF